MSKNPNSRSKPVKRDESMNGAVKFLLAGCAAELYLLIIRRFYVNGTAIQQIAWYDHYFKILIAVGAAVLALGAVLSVVFRADKKKRVWGWALAGSGAFLAVSSALVWVLNAPALTLLCVVVPVAMLLGILWSLYDRECALALTILGLALLVLWVCGRGMSHMYLGLYVKAGAVLFLILLGVIAYLVKAKKLSKLIPDHAEVKPIYMACGISAVAVALSFVNSAIAYYAMWALAIVVFALAVYYTVKQL